MILDCKKMARDTKISLLEKYGLLLDQLDYKFIGNCEDVKTLERILIVLRSGEEGVFPDLIKYCENRLREFVPNSVLLHPPQKILNYSQLSENERKEISNEIQNWSIESNYEVKRMEDTDKISEHLPPVRGQSVKIETKKKEEKNPLEKMEKKTCSQRSYSDWDKFDVEGELIKLDSTEACDTPKEPTKQSLEKDSELQRLVSVSDLSEKERQYIADLEKNKGNEAFKAHDYEEAVVYYTRSLSAFKSAAALNNRAQAYLKMKNYFASVQDCTEVIALDPNNIKALYRRGLAYKENGLYDLAKLDFKILLEMDRENKLAKEQLKQLKQLKLPKPEEKKTILIEEIKSDDTEYTVTEKGDGDNSKTCTRMKIEEVTTTENTVKLTNINYSSSDEEDSSSQLPTKVKEMLQINRPMRNQKTQARQINENEIEKKSLRETKRNVEKTKVNNGCKELLLDAKVIDRNQERENSSPNDKKTRKKCESKNQFVKIKIEDYTSNENPPKECHIQYKEFPNLGSKNKEENAIEYKQSRAADFECKEKSQIEHMESRIGDLKDKEESQIEYKEFRTGSSKDKNESHIEYKEFRTGSLEDKNESQIEYKESLAADSEFKEINHVKSIKRDNIKVAHNLKQDNDMHFKERQTLIDKSKDPNSEHREVFCDKSQKSELFSKETRPFEDHQIENEKPNVANYVNKLVNQGALTESENTPDHCKQINNCGTQNKDGKIDYCEYKEINQDKLPKTEKTETLIISKKVNSQQFKENEIGNKKHNTSDDKHKKLTNDKSLKKENNHTEPFSKIKSEKSKTFSEGNKKSLSADFEYKKLNEDITTKEASTEMNNALKADTPQQSSKHSTLNRDNFEKTQECRANNETTNIANFEYKILCSDKHEKIEIIQKESISKVNTGESEEYRMHTQVFKTNDFKNEIITGDKSTNKQTCTRQDNISNQDNPQGKDNINNKELKTNVSCCQIKSENNSAQEKCLEEEFHKSNLSKLKKHNKCEAQFKSCTIHSSHSRNNNNSTEFEKKILADNYIPTNAENKAREKSDKNEVCDKDSQSEIFISKCMTTNIEDLRNTKDSEVVYSRSHFEQRKKTYDCLTNLGGKKAPDSREINEVNFQIGKEDIVGRKADTEEINVCHEKVTPYEFLCAWTSNAETNNNTRANCLLKIKPEELPSIISNKLDASMLYGLLTAISMIYKMDKKAEGEKYLYYLMQVPRIEIIAMFLSPKETQDIHDLFSTLDCENPLHMKYVNKLLQI